jgi:hypothetical protein
LDGSERTIIEALNMATLNLLNVYVPIAASRFFLPLLKILEI